MLTRLIFILTLFGSAFLSFAIQPILGKMLLPIVGGAPAGWIVTMAFFQLALLGGYTLSHLLRRIPPFQHGLVLLALYAVGLAVLPAHLPAGFDIQNQLGMAVLSLLAQTILLPFIALTATTSALLRIFSHTDDATARDPYYLFIASNAGSLIGLFIYPLALEPFIDLDALSHLWFNLYCALMIAIALCLVLARRHPDGMDRGPDPLIATPAGVSARTIWSWLCLAFIPCSLSMGLTTMLTTDLGSIPLIWTLPLGFYLLSFITAFARRPLLKLDTLHFLHIASAAMIFIFISMNTLLHTEILSALLIDMGMLVALFFIICWSCHQTLAAERPATRHLTFYYLIIALGGALAGILNAFIVPVTLNSVIEFPIFVGLSLCLPMIWNKKMLPVVIRYQNVLFALLAVMAVIILMACYHTHALDGRSIRTLERLVKSILFICLFTLIFKPRFLALLAIPVTLYYMSTAVIGDSLFRQRNFFGSMIVLQNETPGMTFRSLRHGNTTHGLALYDGKGQPTLDLDVSYYSPSGGLRDIYDLAQPAHVATLGLGTGQLACFSKTARMTYFEIDPDIVRIARDYFPYLAQCPPGDIILGDARIELARDKHLYDLLILDVFSSDGIPTHILTLDAIRMYPRHLQPGGVMLFHISNRYLALAPQIAASTRVMGLQAYTKLDQPNIVRHPYALAAQWVAVPLNPAQGADLVKKGWHPVDPGPTRAWTDQRSSLLTAIRPMARRISGKLDLVH